MSCRTQCRTVTVWALNHTICAPRSLGQVVVVCGRNKKLQERLRARPQGPGHCQLHVLGFVDNMHEIMEACDTIITKAGPGTIAEALISGLPILLNGNVPCQVGTHKGTHT